MMKFLGGFLLLVLSLQLRAAEMFISSPADGFVVRDEVGRINIAGSVQYAPGENTGGALGKVSCHGREAAVSNTTLTWSITAHDLSLEGINTITCSYTFNGTTSTKSINVQWIKPTGVVTITSPINGQVIRDLQGKIDIEGSIAFGPGETASPSYGKVTCGDKQGSVNSQTKAWKINSYKLAMEGHNIITCSYTRNGRTDTKSITVLWSKTNIAPVAQFSFTPLAGRAPLLVNFDSSASSDPDGTIVHYSWNFGDGTTASGATASHTYSVTGNYAITLTVLDNESRLTTLTKYIFVDIPSQHPVAQLSATPVSGEFPLNVTFDASLSLDPDGGSLKEYRMDFGDGTQVVSTNPYINHTYQAEGAFTATLVVVDTEDELSAPVETVIQVFHPNLPPVALIDATPVSGFPPLEATFSAARSSDPDGTIASYTWSFPNGVTKTGVEVTHIFEQPGTFIVTLVVRDDRNVPTEATVSIEVASDQVGPQLSMTPQNNSFIRVGTPQFEISHTDPAGIDLSSIRAYMDNVDVTSRLQIGPEATILAYTIDNQLSAGQHELVVQVKDLAGNQNGLAYTYVVELGEIATAYITGTVLDMDGDPLEGVSVQDIYTAPKKKINVQTDADGKYKIPFNQPGTYRLSFNKPGYTESVRTLAPAIVEETSMDLVYLGAADPVVTPIAADVGGEATNSTGSLALDLAPGVLPFNTNVSLTEFTDQRVMPGPLPAMSMFTYAFDMQPQGLMLNSPATLIMDNSLGFPEGTPIVYGKFDRELGRWLDSGVTITIGAKGRTASMSIPAEGFDPGDPNIPGVCRSLPCVPEDSSPPPPPPPPPPCDPPPGVGPGLGGDVPGCIINTITGDLSVDHQLPALVSGGEDYGLNFAYHSTQTQPQFFVSVASRRLDSSDPRDVESTFLVAGKSFRRQYQGTNFPRASVLRGLFDAVNADGSYLPTGSYQYTHVLSSTYESFYATATFFGGPPLTILPVATRVPLRFNSQANSRTSIINRRLSPFGAGWGMTSLERLHVAADGVVLWEDGSKGEAYFTPVGQSAQFVKATAHVKKISSPQINSLKAMNGVFYATDCENNSVYRISASGQFELVAGKGTAGFSGDGGAATLAELNCPVAVAPAETGGFYIADSNNYRIRRVTGDGKIKTIAHHEQAKPLSVSEDKMRAVYFTTRDSVMLITPRGELETYSSKDSGYVAVDLKKPSQVFFNHDDYPMVVDSGHGRILTLYPEGRDSVTTFDGADKSRQEKMSPVSVSFDPVLRAYYILDTQGKLHMWKGQGQSTTDEVTLTENFKLINADKNIKSMGKISAMTYSPELGMAFAINGEVVLTKKVSKSNSKALAVSYISSSGNFDTLMKKSDGTYEITQIDEVKKQYDADGRLIAILRPDSKNTLYQYNSAGLLSLMTFPGGSYELEYDGRGYLTSVRDSANRVTNFVVDANGKLVSIENPDGTEKSFAYEPTSFLLSGEIDEEGKQKTFEYEKGKLIREALPGNRVKDFLPESLRNNQYPVSDAPVSGVPVTKEEVFSTFPSLSGDCAMKARYDRGVLVEYEDCLGSKQRNTINANGQVIQAASAENRIVTKSYDAKGRVLAMSDRNGTTQYTYDSIWGLTATVRDGLQKTVFMSYNAKGLLAQAIDQDNYTTVMGYDEAGNLTSITDALENVTAMEYDEKNNLKATVDPLNHRTEYTRDDAGNVLMLKDPENRVTQFEYDELNRLIAIYDPMHFETAMTYTPKGKIASITDARSNTTLFSYHPYYDVVQSILNPQNQNESFTYDGNERLQTKTNKDGTIINFTYDLNGRLLLKTAATGAIAYDYDRDGLVVGMENQDATLDMTYDSQGRLQTASSSHVPGLITYVYDERGLKSSMTYKIGTATVMSVIYSYNNRKLLSGMTANLNGETITWERFWDELGRPETDIYSNGMTIERRYDAAGRLTYLSNEMNATTPLARFEYAYNPAGTIAEITKTFTRPGQGSLGRQVLSYGYDALDRLTSASTDGQFVYDELGNQLQRGGIYNSLNQLNDDNEFSYTYSMNGNLAEKVSKSTGDKTQYTWDDENRLKQVEVKDSGNTIKRNVSYKYDGSERRIEKTSNGAVTKYLLDQEDIIAEFNADNSIAALYLHGPGIDEPIAMVRDGELYFYAKDHLNSIHTLTDRTGKPVQRYSYSAYGKTKVEKVQESWNFVKNPYAYTSREWEQETGDYYYRARYYDPTTGRFVSEDPIGFLGDDANFYGYVKNDPIKFFDPSGKGPVTGVAAGVVCEIGLAIYSVVADVLGPLETQERINELLLEQDKLRRKNSNQCPDGSKKKQLDEISAEIRALQDQQMKDANKSAFTDLGKQAICLVIAGGGALLPTP